MREQAAAATEKKRQCRDSPPQADKNLEPETSTFHGVQCIGHEAGYVKGVGQSPEEESWRRCAEPQVGFAKFGLQK